MLCDEGARGGVRGKAPLSWKGGIHMQGSRYLMGALMAVLLTGMAGCNRVETQVPRAGGAELTPQQAVIGGRQLMVGSEALSVEQIEARLPASLTMAEAAKVLVRIDASKVVETRLPFELQAWGPRIFTWGFYPGFRSLFRNALYYPFGNHYFPYIADGTAYTRVFTPSDYGGFYPFMFRYGSELMPIWYTRRFTL
jgi:hypothetical protein